MPVDRVINHNDRWLLYKWKQINADHIRYHRSDLKHYFTPVLSYITMKIVFVVTSKKVFADKCYPRCLILVFLVMVCSSQCQSGIDSTLAEEISSSSVTLAGELTGTSPFELETDTNPSEATEISLSTTTPSRGSTSTTSGFDSTTATTQTTTAACKHRDSRLRRASSSVLLIV